MTSHTKKTKSTTTKKPNAGVFTDKTWSVRGVSEEAKTWAAKRAKQENKFVGSYITDLIMMDGPNAKQTKEVARQEDNLTMESVLKEVRELRIEMQNKKSLVKTIRGWINERYK